MQSTKVDHHLAAMVNGVTLQPASLDDVANARIDAVAAIAAFIAAIASVRASPRFEDNRDRP